MNSLDFKGSKDSFRVLKNALEFRMMNAYLLINRINKFNFIANENSVSYNMFLNDSQFELFNNFISNIYDEGFFNDTFNDEDEIDFREDFRYLFTENNIDTFLHSYLPYFYFSKDKEICNNFFKKGIEEKINLKTYSNYVNLVFILLDYCKKNGLTVYSEKNEIHTLDSSLNKRNEIATDEEISLVVLGCFYDSYSDEAIITFLDLLVFLLFNAFLISFDEK